MTRFPLAYRSADASASGWRKLWNGVDPRQVLQGDVIAEIDSIHIVLQVEHQSILVWGENYGSMRFNRDLWIRSDAIVVSGDESG